MKSIGTNIFFIFVVTVGIIILKDFFLWFAYGDSFAEATGIIVVLAVSYFLLGFGINMINFLWSQNKEKTPFLICFILLLFDFVLIYFFINSFGYTGAAYATLITSILLFLSLFFIVLKTFRFKIEDFQKN